MKWGLTSKEARGAVIFVIVMAVIIGSKYLYDRIKDKQYREKAQELTLSVVTPAELFEFDPNTIELPQLMSLGLSKSEAVSVIRYREYGKVFRIKEDLFTCYGISDSLYYALEPYIVIGEEFRLKRSEEYKSTTAPQSTTYKRYKRELLKPSPFLLDTVGVKYLYAIGALSRRQAEVFVAWRDRSGIYSMQELVECYVISDSLASLLEPYIIFTEYEEPKPQFVDINKADSATLRSVYGIGEKSVVEILDFRRRLGGFYSVEQLSQLKVINENNYLKIIRQISCDSCDISKIDVNFASAKTMKGHPYIADRVLRRLLKIRGLKGGWSTIEEMIDDKIFNTEEATRVRPYFVFSEFSAPSTIDEPLF